MYTIFEKVRISVAHPLQTLPGHGMFLVVAQSWILVSRYSRSGGATKALMALAFGIS
jgi:hypothetical protein